MTPLKFLPPEEFQKRQKSIDSDRKLAIMSLIPKMATQVIETKNFFGRNQWNIVRKLCPMKLRVKVILFNYCEVSILLPSEMSQCPEEIPRSNFRLWLSTFHWPKMHKVHHWKRKCIAWVGAFRRSKRMLWIIAILGRRCICWKSFEKTPRHSGDRYSKS